MNPFTRAKRRQKLLANECGQMALFIALIFQVLFVFFAMVVNIGLIIHDKINLQNSVDLAAYYAAGKQAEQLNEIAHINYQIRQDYKLLAWRLRILGNFGGTDHPLANAFRNIATPDERFQNPNFHQTYAQFPSVCITHAAWAETRALSAGAAGENLCQVRPGLQFIPQLNSQPVIFPSPGNIAISIQIEDFRSRFNDRCRDAGPLNWQFASLANLGYRRAIMIRKDMIRSIAANLSAPLKSDNSSFKDRSGDLVALGVEKTLRKNLTKANKESVVSIDGFNGLSVEACKQQSPEATPMWLREVLIYPTITYTDFIQSNGCTPTVGSLEQPVTSQGTLAAYDPSGLLRLYTRGEPQPNTNYHSSRGFEKNPWCMAYVGVKAETAPRKPFAPFGQPIRLTARAFAMPFGGRIGPWDKTTWSPAGAVSDGSDETEAIAPQRYSPNQFINRADERNVPNYARYPGDNLGLKSQLAMSATLPSLYVPTRQPGAAPYALEDYKTLGVMDQHGDVLPWNMNTNQEPALRKVEAAAVAPDLFDITYYSIEPDYYSYYFKNLNASRFSNTTPIADVGNRKTAPLFQAYSVKNQIQSVYLNGADTGTILRPDLYWMVRKPEHLLTAWSPEGPNNFSFPSAFGTCGGKPTGQNAPPTVGDCIYGGRAGYSVQLVSKDYLLSNRHALGGDGMAPGSIKNPPEASF